MINSKAPKEACLVDSVRLRRNLHIFLHIQGNKMITFVINSSESHKMLF